MKPIFALFIASFILMLNAFSAENVVSTNPPAASVVSTNATVQSTLNDVVIDILRGAKSAGSEVYAASKSAVVASVDFAKQQVPDVVEQFLRWKLTEQVVYIAGWLAVAAFLFYLSSRLTKWTDAYRIAHPSDSDLHGYAGQITEYEFGMGMKWVTRIGAVAIITFNIWFNGMVISKILIAPKVYLIEYVVDSVKTVNQSR